MKKTSLLLFLFPVLAALSIACNQPGETTSHTTPPQQKVPYNQYLDSKITVEVFMVDSIETNGSRGWGYDILIEGKPYIHQPTIPAIMGNNGFSSEDDARTAGEFIVSKIKNNILPPSVTPEELDSLGLLD